MGRSEQKAAAVESVKLDIAERERRQWRHKHGVLRDMVLQIAGAVDAPLEGTDADLVLGIMTRLKVSQPEPPPVAEGELVTPALVAWLRERGDIGAAQLVRERDAFGRKKYGQGLTTGDGRDTEEDLLQELGDAIQYGWKAVLQGIDLAHLRPLLLALLAVLDESTRRASGAP